MKKYIFLFLLTIVTISCYSQSRTYSVKGDFNNQTALSKQILSNAHNEVARLTNEFCNLIEDIGTTLKNPNTANRNRQKRKIKSVEGIFYDVDKRTVQLTSRGKKRHSPKPIKNWLEDLELKANVTSPGYKTSYELEVLGYSVEHSNVKELKNDGWILDGTDKYGNKIYKKTIKFVQIYTKAVINNNNSNDRKIVYFGESKEIDLKTIDVYLIVPMTLSGKNLFRVRLGDIKAKECLEY